MNWKRRASWLAMLAVGCAGSGPDEIASGSFVVDAAPLPTIERDIWEVAPAGCEGALHSDLEFGIAESAPELVVVLGDEGVLCVDSYSSLESDLLTIDPDRMDALWLGYVAALQEVEPLSDESYRSSQAGVDLEGYVAPSGVQPQPQPSRLPVDIEDAEAQPQPQPSDPNPTGNEGGSNGSDMDMGDNGSGADCLPGHNADSPGGPTLPPESL